MVTYYLFIMYMTFFKHFYGINSIYNLKIYNFLKIVINPNLKKTQANMRPIK
jgi:hypothetical protein